MKEVKVYAIEEWMEWDGSQGICAICSTRELAEEWVKKNKPQAYCSYEIEEHTVIID